MICAWCETSEDLEASHGICQEHRDQLLAEHYWGKLQGVPSYAERFSDGSEEWDLDEALAAS